MYYVRMLIILNRVQMIENSGWTRWIAKVEPIHLNVVIITVTNGNIPLHPRVRVCVNICICNCVCLLHVTRLRISRVNVIISLFYVIRLKQTDRMSRSISITISFTYVLSLFAISYLCTVTRCNDSKYKLYVFHTMVSFLNYYS